MKWRSTLVTALVLGIALIASAGVDASGRTVPSGDEADPVPLRQWTAAPFWMPDPGDQAAAKGPARVNGVVAPATILPYVAVTPCRLVDTRAASGFPASWGAPSLPAGVDPDPNSLTNDRLFPATLGTAGNPCPIPAGARAIAATVTAWQFTANGKVLLYSGSDTNRPATATVNYRLFVAQSPAANLAQAYAIIPLDENGKFLAFSNNLVDLIVDVNGYYAPTGIVNSLAKTGSVPVLTGAVKLTEGSNISLTQGASDITIAASVPSGPTGPSGPSGPSGASGISDYADFFALMPGDNPAPVAPGTDVQFPNNGPTSAGTITRLTTSAFNLSAVGTYKVEYQVCVTEAGQLILTLNSADIVSSVAGRPTGTSQIVGLSLVTTSVPNSILTVRNPAGNSTALTINPVAGGTRPVSAHLVITRLQ